MAVQVTQLNNVFERAMQVIRVEDPAVKCDLAAQLYEDWCADKLTQSAVPIVTLAKPGLPAALQLVSNKQLSRRAMGSEQGRAAFLHAIVHIEFMAINLALDAVYRFQDMPHAYYTDWLRIAGEEARHFILLRERLHEYGFAYGDFKAHAGLWQIALDSAADVLVRMALVPRVMEARGLDVTPGMIQKLTDVGDLRSAAILEIILADEIDHVACGTRWFQYVCEMRNLDSEATFCQLIEQYLVHKPRGPYAVHNRKQAGFTDQELTYLQGLP